MFAQIMKEVVCVICAAVNPNHGRCTMPLENGQPIIVLISGGSGAGKSVLVRKIFKDYKLSRPALLEMDHYYHDLSHINRRDRHRRNFDHPDALDSKLLADHLAALVRGESVNRPTYDFAEHIRTEETKRLSSTRVILVDGIMALHFKELRRLAHLSVFFDIPADIRLLRRIRRDMRKRGRSAFGVMRQYEKTVRPMHEKYIEPSKEFADVIIFDNDNYQEVYEKIDLALCETAKK